MNEFKQFFENIYLEKWDEFDKISQKIQNIINYQFKNKENLYNALSIRGSQLPKENFERMEFLGDALLKAINGVLLYEKSSEFNPKELTELRSKMEENEYLAELAKELQFNEIGKILGIGKLSNNQAADCFEALIGAIFIDNEKDFKQLNIIVKSLTHFEKTLKKLKSTPKEDKNPKSTLQEWAQKQFGTDYKIEYPIINKGQANAPAFFVHAIIKKISSRNIEHRGDVVGPSTTKKEGEKDAARNLLKKLEEEGEFEPERT